MEKTFCFSVQYPRWHQFPPLKKVCLRSIKLLLKSFGMHSRPSGEGEKKTAFADDESSYSHQMWVFSRSHSNHKRDLCGFLWNEEKMEERMGELGEIGQKKKGRDKLVL